MKLQLLSLSILFSAFFLSATAQNKKLLKSFKLGTFSYNLYELSKSSSKSTFDTTFYVLYRAGKKIIMLKEMASITDKTTSEKLFYARFENLKSSIKFYTESPFKPFDMHIYKQNKNGNLTFESFPKKEIDAFDPFEKKPNPTKSTVSTRTTTSGSSAKPAVLQTVIADTPPSYPNGITAMRSFISRNLIYPEDAIGGKVLSRFVVEKDGSITNIEIVQSLSPSCDNEVIRLLKKMPKWLPAQLNDKPMVGTYLLPITFSAN